MNPLNFTSKPSNYNAKILWSKAPSIKQQQFSLPDSIIYYMVKNPSTPETYLKLAKSCKYFFQNNPLLIVKRIWYGGKIFCSSDDLGCKSKNQRCCVTADIKKINNSKLWLTNQICRSQKFISNGAALFTSKIYRCEDALLSIKSCRMNIKEFKIWGKMFQKIYFYRVKIIKNDGRTVRLENILESIPNVKEFNYSFNIDSPAAATSSTMKNIAKLHLNNLSYMSLKYIPEVINVEDLAQFIKNHRDTKFYFDFVWNIFEGYSIQLDELIDAIIESKIPNRIIIYFGQDKEKLCILRSRYSF